MCGLAAGLLAAPARPGPSLLAAQETIVERQVPVDSARGLRTIGPDLRRELGLFEDVEGFVEARLFELDDGRTVLEISFRRDGGLLRERRYLPPEVVASLRSHLIRRIAERDVPPVAVAPPEAGTADGAGAPTDGGDRQGEDEDGQGEDAPAESGPVADGPVAKGPGPVVDRDGATARDGAPGRRGLLLGHALLGVAFHGWAVPELLGVRGARPRAAAHLATAGLSYLVPHLLTRDLPVDAAHRHASLWGGTRGIAYGLLAASAVTGEETYRDRAHLGSALAFSVAGSVLGYRAVDERDLDEGTALLRTTLADVGTLAGAATAYAAGLYDDRTRPRLFRGRGPWIVPTTEPAHRHAPHLTVLALTGAGFAAGHWLGRRDSFTVGDVHALRSAVALGVQLALPLAELTVREDDGRWKRYAAGAVIGTAFGAAGGAEALRGLGLERGDGLLLNAGQLAGTLGALGLAWFVAPDEDHARHYTMSSALGGVLGLAVAARAIAGGTDGDGDGGEEDAGSRAAGGVTGRDTPHGRENGARQGVRIELSPAGVLAGAASGRFGAVPPTVLRIRF